MKTIRLSVVMMLTVQVFTALANARQLHITRKDMLFAKPAVSHSINITSPSHVVRRNMSQAQYVGVARGASLAGAQQITVGGSPYRIVSGDFTGQGIRDIAAVISDDRTSSQFLSILIGRGDTTFNPPVTTPANFDKKTSMYAADLNKDGKDDIILVRSGAVDVFLSAGSGFFRPATTYADGVLNPSAVAIADVNGDGILDLFLADGSNGTLDTFLGNGDGSFKPAAASSLQAGFAFGVFADVNKDGKLDLVTDSLVFLGTGTGLFNTAVPLLGGPAKSCDLPKGSVAVGDVNGDGYSDIVVAGCDSDMVTIFLANGMGGFSRGKQVWAGFGPQSVSIADVNGDGFPDIVSSNVYPGDVTILVGDGKGNFRAPKVGYAFGGTMLQPVVIDDFNHDGHLDIVALSWGYSPKLSFLKGVGDGSFVAAQDFFPPQQAGDFGSYGMSIASADFNQDGRPDVVLGGIFGSGNDGNMGGDNTGIVVFLDSASGRLQQAGTYGTGGALANVAVGDFNRDGKMDIVAADINTGAVNLFFGNGDGSFRQAQSFPSAPYGASGIVVGDFNKDGYPDIAVIGWPTGLYILLNSKNGQFQSPIFYGMNDDAWTIETADLNNDGKLDLVIPHFVANTFSVFLGNGNGTFQALPDFTNGSINPGGVALRDLNSDGKLDMAFSTVQGAAVALGNGDGTFQTPTFYDASHGSELSSTGDLVLADLNGDGNLDMLFTNIGFGTVDVLTGNGDGTFGALSEFPVGAMPFGLLAADLNGDGSPDVVVASVLYPGVTTLLNSEGSTLTLTTSQASISYGKPVVLTATVAITLGGGKAPTGTVTFLDNGVTLGSSTVGANATASLLVSMLAPGSHKITGVYSGDSRYFAATSAAVQQQVQAPPSPTYSLTANPTSRNLRPGQSAVFNITATPMNGLNASISFSCGPLPQGMNCRFSQSSARLSAGRSVMVQLVVTMLPTRCSSTRPTSCQPQKGARAVSLPVRGVAASIVKQLTVTLVVPR